MRLRAACLPLDRTRHNRRQPYWRRYHNSGSLSLSALRGPGRHKPPFDKDRYSRLVGEARNPPPQSSPTSWPSLRPTSTYVSSPCPHFNCKNPRITNTKIGSLHSSGILGRELRSNNPFFCFNPPNRTTPAPLSPPDVPQAIAAGRLPNYCGFKRQGPSGRAAPRRIQQPNLLLTATSTDHDHRP